MKTMKINRSTLYIFLSTWLLLGSSCSDDDNVSMENVVPLNCVYPGSLELDQATQDELSQFKQSPLQGKAFSRGFPKYE
ncbi:MAG: Unknown protein [uncultured Thiotrichaceae bacterium]|uniref:Secreted protein n=1 Tax=uncultured Thiotrichaceae bacterium TaxID=298394 RepID=A0A6S6T371_9GAMM|nr:MAG: Unknown protein [uncultured Thiotrichaceae bacterium]